MIKKTELQEIREMYHAMRPQFAEVFLGISSTMLWHYEMGHYPVPEKVMMMARYWKKVLEDVKK